MSTSAVYFLLGAAFTSGLSYVLYMYLGKNAFLISMSVMTGLFALLFGTWQMMLWMQDTASADSTMTVFDDMRLGRLAFLGGLLGCIPGWLVYTEKMTGDVFLWVFVGILTVALAWAAIDYRLKSRSVLFDWEDDKDRDKGDNFGYGFSGSSFKAQKRFF